MLEIQKNNTDSWGENIVLLVKYLYTLKFNNKYLFMSNKKT